MWWITTGEDVLKHIETSGRLAPQEAWDNSSKQRLDFGIPMDLRVTDVSLESVSLPVLWFDRMSDLSDVRPSLFILKIEIIVISWDILVSEIPKIWKFSLKRWVPHLKLPLHPKRKGFGDICDSWAHKNFFWTTVNALYRNPQKKMVSFFSDHGFRLRSLQILTVNLQI